MDDRFFVILNPFSGRGQGTRCLPEIEHELRAHQLSYEIHQTRKPLEATEVARQASKNFSVIVAAGGDGTVNETVNGLVSSNAAFGVIPIGSGNDFAKCLHLLPNVADAVRALKNGKRRQVDIAKINNRYYVNGLGIGLDGAVAHRNRAIRKLRGRVAYLWSAVSEALTYKAQTIRMQTEQWHYEGDFMMAGASNGHCHGGDFLLAPNAKVDDGLLDIYLVTDMHPLRRLRKIPTIKKGQHLTLPEVQMHTASWLEFASSEKLLAHLDGEPFVIEPGIARVEVLPKSLTVISH